MAKSLELDTEQSALPKHDLIFEDINQEKSPPLSLTFVPAIMDIKESWDKSSTSLQIPRQVENHYRTHITDTSFLIKHPLPNSIIVQSNQSRAGNRSSVTPTNKEGRKLDVLVCHLYLVASFVIRVSNYQATMGAYHRLWNKILPILQTTPEDVRTAALNIHLEAITLAKQQHLAAHHIADAASKSLVSSITLRQHAWVRSSRIMNDARTCIEELPFDGAGLFNEKTDYVMENLHKIHKTARLYAIQQPRVKSWADAFGEDLYYIVTKYSGSLLLQKKYKDVEPTLKIKEVDGLELVKKFSEEMESMLRRKVEAVERLVEAAEDADLYHEFNSSLEFDYYNAVLINEKDENDNYVELGNEFVLEPNEHFNNLLVNTTYSDIQLPTNVYNKDPAILNGVYMSEALNPIFVDNFERDPTLTWQYFGSSTGFFRLYPGIKWTPDENGVLSFDCRNRGWYIQAATSPKDIVIIVDISGSMKGLRLTIAKHTVVTILDTLGENDFVNIIAYNDYVHYVESCFKGILVQADRDNREHFKQLVDELQAKGVGTVNKALTEAFRILMEFRSAGQGGLCNQAIMLITDGAMEDYKYVFEKFNWPDRKVRVFTYLIGREVSFAQNVKWIACNNKGYYTQISTLADVQENVMEYLHVLSRPMVINHDHDIIWTEAYMDSALFASQAQSLLLMTTVAMPVFSKKNETRSHGILLGVVGSDVPLRELLKLAPRYKLGVHGYAFLNTNNGYILSHPDLRPLYKEGKKLKPKPNYNSVDLSEVEWEDLDETLRTAMINGETGYLSMDVKVPVDKGKRVLFLTNDYFYTDISGTPFSLGVVLSRGHGEYILLGNTSVEEGLHDLLQPDITLANEWIYCITDIDPGHRKLSQLEAVIRFLTGEEADLECDEELVQEVLFDAVVTAPMEAYWTTLALNMSDETEGGVEMAFMGTRAGLIRSSLYVGSEKVSNRKFLSSDKESIFTMDHFPLWYRRAAEYPSGSFIYSFSFEEASGGMPEAVTVSTSVTVTVGGKTGIAAVFHPPEIKGSVKAG
nr:voltage-dependent calcium channel subunit alpha-2/delta-4 [Pogona vitticeps]